MAFDQTDLPCPLPALNLFFTRNGGPNVRELFEVDESGHAIFSRESSDEASFVLTHTPREVICDPDIKHSGSTGQNVGVVGAHDVRALCISGWRP